jgi:hypothetical protein
MHRLLLPLPLPLLMALCSRPIAKRGGAHVGQVLGQMCRTCAHPTAIRAAPLATGTEASVA